MQILDEAPRNQGRRSLLIGASALVAALVGGRQASAQPAAKGAPAAAAAASGETAGPFKLPPLPYSPRKNERAIDARTMELHHDKHHAAYVKALNDAAAADGSWAGKPLEVILAGLDQVPEGVRTVVRNNGGGHANHSMFWEVMGGKGGQPTGDLAKAIDSDFGSFDKLKESFNGAGAKVFGSGWVFVTVDQQGKLALVPKPNQDTPLMEGKRVLFGNDVWEHAYYLRYQNRRPDYLKAWWEIVDWDKVADRYARARKGELTI